MNESSTITRACSDIGKKMEVKKILLKVEEELYNDENKYYEEMYKWQSFYGKCTECYWCSMTI